MIEANEGPRRSWVSFARARGVFTVAAVGGLLLIVGGAAAATGLLPVGSEIKAGGDQENPYEHGADDQTIVARGTSAIAGPWRLTTLRTAGDENSPAGDCVQLLLTQPPPGSPIAGTLLCQDAGKAEFKADSVPVVNAVSGDAETLVFGAAPASTSAVRLTLDGGKTIAANTSEVLPGSAFGSGFPGRPWVVVVPAGHKSGQLDALDENGGKQTTLDASRYLDQLAIWQRSVASKG
jgi:hypothetical protein